MLKIEKRWRPRQRADLWSIFENSSKYDNILRFFSNVALFCCTTVCSGSLCVIFLWLFMVIFLLLFSLLGFGLWLMCLGLWYCQKTFHVWICLVLGIFCALPRLRCLLRILSSCFLPTWGPTGLNLSSSLPFGRFRPLTTSFFKIVQFWEYSRLFSIIFNIFRLLSITLEYSRLLSITLDYSRLLSITLSIALDYSRLLSLTLAYSRLLSRLLSIIFWCFLHTSMVSWLFFDYGAFVFQSGSTSFEERHLRGNPGFQTLLWTSKMSKSHPLSLFSVASQHLTVVLTFFCFCLRFFLSHPWWSSPTPANEVMNEQMTPPTATWQVNSLCFSSILGVTTSLWGGEFLQNTWGFPKRAWNRPKTA